MTGPIPSNWMAPAEATALAELNIANPGSWPAHARRLHTNMESLIYGLGAFIDHYSTGGDLHAALDALAHLSAQIADRAERVGIAAVDLKHTLAEATLP